MTVYVLLFGAESNSPLGLPRKIWWSFCNKDKVEKVITLDNERIKLLLQDYVIDLGNLKDVSQNNNPDDSGKLTRKIFKHFVFI